MISAKYITGALESESLSTNIIRKKSTNAIDLIDLEIKKGRKKEVFSIYSCPFSKQKVFIESKKRNNSFTQLEVEEIEKKIKEAVLSTPENIFPNLFQPIYFETNF